MSNPHLDCPYCDANPVDNYWLKHILAKHTDQLFDSSTPDGKFNLSALKFSTERKSLPQMRFKKMTKYVCLSCQRALGRETYADKHLNHLCASKAKAESLLSEINPQTPLLPSPEAVGNQEVIAYKSVIIKLLDELDQQRWIVGRWDAARDIPEIYQLIEDQVPEVEVSPYDLTTETVYKKEAKIINLDRDYLKQFRNAKF